jgi:hypothetical protein
MINGQLPKPKKPTSTVQANSTARRRPSAIGRIAHELINQLTVLNLVGYDVVSRNEARPVTKIARDTEIFERTIHEATLLAEQLAHYVTDEKVNPYAHQSLTVSDQGRVVRMLRSVPSTDR